MNRMKKIQADSQRLIILFEGILNTTQTKQLFTFIPQLPLALTE